MLVYSLRTWCGLNLDSRALFWVFTTHRSQNIYNCLWLHCFWFKCPIVECLNDSSMFLLSNDRPTTLFPLVDVYVYLCIDSLSLSHSLLLVSIHRLWSSSLLAVASSVEICFALGCNMSIKHDARLFTFVSSPFPFSHLLCRNISICFWKPHIRIRIDFSVCKPKTRPNYGAFVSCTVHNWTWSMRAARKHLYIAVFFTICRFCIECHIIYQLNTFVFTGRAAHTAQPADKINVQHFISFHCALERAQAIDEDENSCT